MPDLDCPSAEELKAFVLGELPDTLAEPLCRHLEGCPHCEAIARELDGVDDAIILAVRQGALLATADEEPRSNVGSDSQLTREPGGLETTSNAHAGPTSDPPRAQPAGKVPSGRGVGVPVIAGYEELELVGQGGMGAVYRARDTRLKRQVALKVLRRADGTHDQRFRIEAEAVARLQHPHIVQIFEIGQWQAPDQAGPALYVALEYIRGGCLDRVLRRGPLTVAESARLVEVLAGAVQSAHEAGIVHRDLKPANVLLAEPVAGSGDSLSFGFAKIADFGLARRLDTETGPTEAGQLLGTPAYMAPEQADGRGAVGPAADIWALGVILYECLTGARPFQGQGFREVLARVCLARPKPPRELRAEIPEALEAICLRCLEKDPAQRYPSAAALADDLARFRLRQRSEPASASCPPPLPSPAGRKDSPLPRLSSKRAVLAGVSILASTALLVGAIFVWRPWQARTTPEAPGDRSAAEPLKGSVDVVVYESARAPMQPFEPTRRRQRLRLHERLALPLQQRDWVRIEAKLNQPAYLYLVWIDADGKVAPLWPWLSPDPERPATWNDPRAEERPRQELILPQDLSPETNVMPLGEEPAGVVTLLLLAREKPLSNEEAGALQRLLTAWKPNPATEMVFAVWLENGKRVEDEKERAPILGKSQDARNAEEQARRVMQRIHDRFGYVRGVCFNYQGKGNHEGR